jgi:hypothetical protein
MEQCTVDGCKAEVTKQGYKFCLPHWKADNEAKLTKCKNCGKLMDSGKPLCQECSNKSRDNQTAGRGLTAKAIGEKVNLSANRVNAILVELAWITKGPGEHGWIRTPQGRKNGAVDREFGVEKSPFVQWPDSILSNRAFTDAVREFKGEKPLVQESASSGKSEEVGFREKFPATHRATDGHMVRSRAEMLIDNWLYNAQVIHAYERKVPIEEELYCDFYLPTGKVYIEFWGLESDAAYAARKKTKMDLYRKNNLSLIELRDDDIKNLEDILPAKLRPFDIKVS